MRFSVTVIYVLMLSACASPSPVVTRPAPDNPYAQSYVSRTVVATKTEPGPPQIFLGNDKQADYQRQLEKGYELLGYSSFQTGAASPQKLAEQAARVNADVALIYSVQIGKTPAAVRLDVAKAEAAAREKGARTGQEQSVANGHPPSNDVLYSYFASYWTRLPTPILGVHVQGTAESRTGETGLTVLAVIEGSPAAAVLRKDDVLLRLGETRLDNPQALIEAAKHYAGQSVQIAFERDEELLSKTLTLGSRH